MSKKYIILDTETTGLEVKQGHRVIEIGAVLLNDRKKSEDHFSLDFSDLSPVQAFGVALAVFAQT